LDSIVAYSTHATDFRNTIPPKADIRQGEWHVRYVPLADIRREQSFLTASTLIESQLLLFLAMRLGSSDGGKHRMLGGQRV